MSISNNDKIRPELADRLVRGRFVGQCLLNQNAFIQMNAKQF